MSTITSEMVKTEELKIVEFKVGSSLFGINVAKTNQILKPVNITSMPNSHSSLKGIFELRGKIIPLIDLSVYLNIPKDEKEEGRIIVAEINDKMFSFFVDSVTTIKTFNWSEVEENSITNSDKNETIIGILKDGENIILLLDFEKIISEVTQDGMSKEITDVEYITERESRKIYVIDDSAMIRNVIVQSLKGAGYKNLSEFKNGEEAFENLKHLNTDNLPELIITDLEMPKMDGHMLTENIRQNDMLKNIPIVVFSSLINDRNIERCKKEGATYSLSKPDIKKLVSILDKHLLKK